MLQGLKVLKLTMELLGNLVRELVKEVVEGIVVEFEGVS